MTTLGARLADPPPVRAAFADLVLEGLTALKKIGRTDQGQFFASAPAQGRPRDRQAEVRSLDELMEDDEQGQGRGKRKKYYN